MRMKLTYSSPRLPIGLCLTGLIAFASIAIASAQSTTSSPTSEVSPAGQQNGTEKLVEPGVLGVMFYLDPRSHTITSLPREGWKIVAKAKQSGWATATAVASLQLAGASSALHIPPGYKSEFVFGAVDPADVKLYLCSQNDKKNFRQAAVLSVVKRYGPFRAGVSQTPVDGIPVEITRYGNSSFKVTAMDLAYGEYVIMSGKNAFTFGIP